MPWDIALYHTRHGKCPLERFLKAQDGKAQAAILASIDALRLNGPALGHPHVGALKGKKWAPLRELRISQGRREFRVIFAATPAGFVLLHGFQKPATEKVEFATAKERYKDWIDP